MVHLGLCIVSMKLSKSQEFDAILIALDNILFQPSNQELLLL